MAVVAARRKATADHIAPQQALQRFAQHFVGGRVGLADTTFGIDHDYPTGQHIEQAFEPLRQAFFLRQFVEPLCGYGIEFLCQFRNAVLQQVVGLCQLL